MAKKVISQALREKLELDFNGCPFMDERTQGSLDDLTGMRITIEDIYPMADYHAVIFEEVPEKFFFTGGALKNLCLNYQKDEVVGLTIELQQKVKTSSKKDFRPMKVIFDDEAATNNGSQNKENKSK